MADVETAKLLIKVGAILSVIVPLFIGVLLLMTIIGIIIGLPLVVLGIWIYRRMEDAIALVDEGRYKDARDTLLIPSILALILTSRIGGALMLIGLVLLPSENEVKEGEVRVY
ncbi:hypothetical protein [Palaeococcus ferrophilus]|uniref:hypothetical protein n=1 Tax=Palaeococcus ferrophilus TaxID=83868 RepID=UPI00064FE41B|nr:hypothetical protein [Palaeococcus ferrophilus]